MPNVFDKDTPVQRTIAIQDDQTEPVIIISPPQSSWSERHYASYTDSFVGSIRIWDEQTW